MKFRSLFVAALVTRLALVALARSVSYVSDEATAIKIAVAAWGPIYGAAHIAGEGPYQATLRDGVWIVTGSVPHGAKGGAAFAKISQKDGRVLFVTHYK
jgi:NTF2 fold immunity protein of polymorphic toxin system component